MLNLKFYMQITEVLKIQTNSTFWLALTAKEFQFCLQQNNLWLEEAQPS